ncbi:MAG: mycofactocin precursor MftA [Rhodospirillales bacterium]
MRSEYEASLSPRDGDWTTDGEPAGAALSPVAGNENAKAGKPAIVEEILIEEVSIDGMCGVY